MCLSVLYQERKDMLFKNSEASAITSRKKGLRRLKVSTAKGLALNSHESISFAPKVASGRAMMCAFAIAFIALLSTATVQAQTPQETPVFHISAGEKLPGFQLAQLAGLDEANLTFSVPTGASVSGAATMLAEYTFTRVQQHGHGELSNTCNHYTLPEQITVIVNPKRIEYLTEHITLSAQLRVTSDRSAVNYPVFKPHCLEYKEEWISRPKSKGQKCNHFNNRNELFITFPFNGDIINS
jgi:hypothetical protein